MVRSSTTLASTNSGLPLPFTQMKSSSGPLGELHVAPDQVVDLHHALVGRAEAQGPTVAPGQPEVAAVPVVARRRVTGRRPLLGPLVDLLPGAAAGVERAAVPERLDRRLVHVAPAPTGSTGPRRAPCPASRGR